LIYQVAVLLHIQYMLKDQGSEAVNWMDRPGTVEVVGSTQQSAGFEETVCLHLCTFGTQFFIISSCRSLK
jgi:hypothetical protein